MGSRRLDTIADYNRHGYRLRVDCLACKRTVILEPLPILTRCHVKKWSYRIEAIAERMVCAECGSKRVRLGPAFGDW